MTEPFGDEIKHYPNLDQEIFLINTRCDWNHDAISSGRMTIS